MHVKNKRGVIYLEDAAGVVNQKSYHYIIIKGYILRVLGLHFAMSVFTV